MEPDISNAEQWWGDLTEKRRIEIWRWVEQPHKKTAEPAPGQMDIISALNDRSA
ncbi:hypothetical protein [Corynebacterium cystitidis]|uniref:hypothetical protein n=1 Tax=Corynebacterium cystitidis TaxID=35757 RepID=UPI00211DFD4C|nr:hypothetical protein [Corynebacterium cystitidis]